MLFHKCTLGVTHRLFLELFELLRKFHGLLRGEGLEGDFFGGKSENLFLKSAVFSLQLTDHGDQLVVHFIIGRGGQDLLKDVLIQKQISLQVFDMALKFLDHGSIIWVGRLLDTRIVV